MHNHGAYSLASHEFAANLLDGRANAMQNKGGTGIASAQY
jgi:hypothetical protein